MSSYPEFPEDEIQIPYGKREEFGVQAGPYGYKILPISLLTGSLKAWIEETHPDTTHVNMGPSMGVSEGLMWKIWGFKSLPATYDMNTADWSTSIIGLKLKADTKTQLTAILENLKALTEAVAKLVANS